MVRTVGAHAVVGVRMRSKLDARRNVAELRQLGEQCTSRPHCCSTGSDEWGLFQVYSLSRTRILVRTSLFLVLLLPPLHVPKKDPIMRSQHAPASSLGISMHEAASDPCEDTLWLDNRRCRPTSETGLSTWSTASARCSYPITNPGIITTCQSMPK